jgi:sugar phosphate isomerase/epimerase
MSNYTNLAIHTITTKNWSLTEAVQAFSKAGVGGISIWRDAVGDLKPKAVRQLLSDHGIQPIAYVRGGFFPSVDPKKRAAALEDNRKMIEEAAEMGLPQIVLVVGAEPKQDLHTSRQQIHEGIETIEPLAAKLGVQLAIEPLHPMYADTRSAINSLESANEMAESIDSPWVGVAIDVYHVWWEPGLEQEIARCGRNGNLFAYHICDWKVPTEHFLTDRGLMGEGCIPIDQITGWVRQAGFTGMAEVEIFSTRYWGLPSEQWFEQILTAYNSLEVK